jgi:hypothetical protein
MISRSTFAKKKKIMEKVEEYQFKLVEGQYNSRGSKILLGLINSKINFHQLEHFSNEI